LDARLLGSRPFAAANTGLLDTDFVAARYTSDGSVDLTFALGGKVTTDFSGMGDRVSAAVLQPDGKIVAAGVVQTLSFAFANFGLARYDAGISSTTTTTTSTKTSTTAPVACDLTQLPQTSPAGVRCLITVIENTLDGPPQLDCATHCRCSLERRLGRVSKVIARAAASSSAGYCSRRLHTARRAATLLSMRTAKLVMRHCIGPAALGSLISQQTAELSERTNALYGSKYCAERNP